MRTTVNIDEDVLDAAKAMAYVRQVSLGSALSLLARKGMNAPVGTRRDPETGLWMFDVPNDAPEITPEIVERAQDFENLEYAKSFRKP